MSKQLARWMILLLVVAVIIGGGLFLFINGILNQIPRYNPEGTTTPDGETTAPGESVAQSDPQETVPASEPAEKIPQNDNIVNILLVGHNGKSESVRGSSNTMILCTLNKSTGKLTMTSFHSDLWVYVPGHNDQRLSYAGKKGGPKLISETLEHNFGVKADHSIMIDLFGFADAIDAIGGVAVSLRKGEAECLNAYSLTEKRINESWSLKEGTNVLTGMQALSYARMEEKGTDFGRTDRQRIVISALLKKLKTMDIDSASKQVKSLLELVSTDMTNEQIISLLIDLLPVLDNMETVSENIPVKGTYRVESKGDGNALVMNEAQMDENRKYLETLLTQ